jgi:hypothetical protein
MPVTVDFPRRLALLTAVITAVMAVASDERRGCV